MCALQIILRGDEEILSEAEWAVLTNQRLVAALNRKDRSEITDDVPLSDIVTFKKSNGGQESRMQPGLKFLGGGGAVYILLFLLSNIISFNDARIILDIKQKIESNVITLEEAKADPYLRERVESDLFQRSNWNLRGLSFLEIGLFLGGAAGILIGIYLIIGSIMRIKPFTVVVFSVLGSRDIPVHFPGNDHPEADNMMRLFTRAKRGI